MLFNAMPCYVRMRYVTSCKLGQVMSLCYVLMSCYVASRHEKLLTFSSLLTPNFLLDTVFYDIVLLSQLCHLPFKQFIFLYQFSHPFAKSTPIGLMLVS